ncbi:MAG: hypothetical protein IKC64_01520 [Clostridia bacterium]|nr:hypothetical protein [Clostridia bacterium]
MDNDIVAYNKLPPSNRLFISLETIVSALALLFSVGSLVLFFFNAYWGAKIFGWLFYPTVICIAMAIMLGIGQLCRGFQVSALIPLVLVIAALVFAIVVFVNEIIVFGVVYLPPFTFIG